MAVFSGYKAKDSSLVSEAQNLHSSIDLGSLNLELLSKGLDDGELSLLMPYLDSINVLINRAQRFINEIHHVKV